MIELGIKQALKVVHTTDFGVYLGEEGKEEKVLLPKKQVPEGTQFHDTIEVFVYRDSQDRLIATTNEPMLYLGETALLRVKEITKIGAFLDWGLEKDLLLPYKEQTREIYAGECYPVALYVDKSGRLCATMRIGDYLREDSPYQKDEQVEGTVYGIHEEIGAFVVVDNQYNAVIPKKELFESLSIGDKVTARVTDIRSDGKLNLSLRKKAHEQMEEDAAIVLSVMERYQGVLPFTDKTVDKSRVMQEFKLSKNAFKRAVGRLLKEGRIKITESTIESVSK